MRGIRLVAASFLLLFSGGSALADPPDRVGRLSYIEGSVSIRGPEEDVWAPARLNWPVTSGSAIWTEPGGRAEIQVGAAAVRIDQETELDIVQLDDDRMELAVPQGAANIHVPAGASIGPIWVSTATGPVTISAPGFYSIVDGEIRTIAAPQTPFDQWAMARAQSLAAAQAETLRHVSPQMTGYQDLAAHGAWTVTPDYGAVWYPRAVPAGWAPYRYGHWEYIAPWGWTWIDDMRWGFAPFHYGRWVRVHGRWAWWPGRPEPRPVYAPALVVFIGIGGGGHDHHHHHDRHRRPHRWVPLAPHEHFRPYYRASEVHVRNVNRTTVKNVTVVNNTVNVDRLVNRNAATALRRSEIERPRLVASPPPRAERQGEREARREGRRDEHRAIQAPVAAPAPAVIAPPQAATPRREVRDDRRRERVERRAMPAPVATPSAPVVAAPPTATPSAGPAQGRSEARQERRREREDRRVVPPPTVAPMTAPAPVERPRIVRPVAPATERREAREERRNPRETRIAPPVAPPQVQPRLAPPTAPREAARQRERAQPAAVQAQPAQAPRVERAPTRPAVAPQPERVRAEPERDRRRGDDPQRKRGDGPPPKG